MYTLAPAATKPCKQLACYVLEASIQNMHIHTVAIISPIPREPPVTSTTLSLTLNSSLMLVFMLWKKNKESKKAFPTSMRILTISA